MEEYSVSHHAQERYAERIMDKDNKADVFVFINQHSQKIIEDVNKMVQFGEKIYEGRALNGDYNKGIVQIYIKDLWIVIVDPNKKNVITLFVIDLGLGDEYNRDYVGKLMDKLTLAKEDYKEQLETINTHNKELREIIESNTAEANEYKRLAKSLIDQNEAYETLIKENETNKQIAETEVRKIIGTLTARKIF